MDEHHQCNCRIVFIGDCTIRVFVTDEHHTELDLQEGVLFTHCFHTQTLPLVYRYVTKQTVCACIVANSSPVCLS